MKRLALILLLSLPALVQAADWEPMDDRELRTRLENAPDVGAGEEGMLLFEGRYYRQDRGLTELRVQRLTRVTSEWALEHVSDPRLRFDSSRQELEIHRCRTYLPDGDFVDSPVNAFNEVTPGALAQAVDFMDIREMVVTHTGLVPGAVLFLDYSLRDTAPAGMPTGELIFPQGDLPVLEMEIVAEGLFGETVNPKNGLHALPDPESGNDRLRWLLRELPTAPGEARHRLGDQLPHVQLSPLESWEDVVIALAESIEASLTDTTGLAAWLREIEAEGPFLSDWEAVEAWLDGMAEGTALLRFDDWHWRRAPRSVARVLETSVATPMERIALLGAALGSRDLPVQWLFPRRWEEAGKRLLSTIALGDPLALLSTADASSWQADPAANRLEPRTSELLRSDYGIAAGRSGPVHEPNFASTLCRIELKQYWKLEDGAWRLDGLARIPASLRVDRGTPESDLRSWLETEGSSVDALRLRNSVRFDARGITPLPETDERGLIRLALPHHPVTLETLLPPGMDRRRSSSRALLFPRESAQFHLTWILDLPENLEPMTLAPLGVTGRQGTFTLTRELEENRLTVHYDLEAGGLPVKPGDYPAYRELVNAALDPAATQVVLRERIED